MLAKKNKKGKCPLNKMKQCQEDCVLYRKGTRVNDLTQEVTPIEICAFNVIADNIEQLHNRTYQMQKEMGEMKNVTAFHVMADLGMASVEEAAAQAERVLIPIAEKLKKEKNELPEK